MIARSIISLVSDHDLRPQPHTRPHVRISTALAQSPQNLPLFLRSHTPVHNSFDPFVGLIAACVRGKPTHPSPPQPPTHPPHQPTDPLTQVIELSNYLEQRISSTAAEASSAEYAETGKVWP